jgi:hypothetical protein
MEGAVWVPPLVSPEGDAFLYRPGYWEPPTVEEETDLTALWVVLGLAGAAGLITGIAVGVAGAGGGGSGSCPYVYLWDGEEYRYHADLSGSVLAAGLDFFRPQYYGPGVYELGDFAAQEGVYRLKAREVTYEATYFDAATLLVVDVPEGHAVYSDWSFTSQLEREPSLGLVTVRSPRAPVSATAENGDDVLREVRAADGVPLPVTADGLSRVELDFGPLEHPERARLVLTSWGYYADLRGRQQAPFSAGTTIETPDDRGDWQVRTVAGKSAGDSRTWVIDLGGVLAADDTRLRITMAHLPSVLDVLDAVLLDDSEPAALQVTRLAPRLAELRDGGAARLVRSTLEHRIFADDSRLPANPDARLAGWYTRFGDVRPLLDSSDDRFVVMVHGDELVLEFDEPPPVPGMTRRAFLEADLFYTLKDHPYGRVTETAEPIPYHGMERYPYDPAAWPYAGDAEYRRYLDEWNTRRVDLP